MGEYADELMSNGMMEDYPFGYGRTRRRVAIEINWLDFEIQDIVKETDRSWLIKLSAGVTRWYPKSKCIVTEKTLSVPEWLVDKIIEDEHRAEKRINRVAQNTAYNTGNTPLETAHVPENVRRNKRLLLWL